MNDRMQRGLVSLALAVILLVVGTLAQRVYTQDTQYVFWLFLFGASLFLADATLTLTRMPAMEAAAEREKEAAASPWRVAFAVAFVLTLIAAARTGSSFITATAMLLAVVAAMVYLVRRRFFANLVPRERERGGSDLRAALQKGDHEKIAELLEARVQRSTDVGQKNALLLSLGAVHVVRGAYDDAVKAFERIDRNVRAEAIDMGSVVDLNVASAYVAMGDYEAAERALAKIDETALPEEFRIAYRINRSALLVGKGAHAEAIRFVDGLDLASVPPRTRFPFLRDLAEALAASGTDPARAMAVATNCLEIEDGPQALNVVGFVLIVEKKFEEARTRLVKALDLNPDGRLNRRVFAETLYYLGLAKQGVGEASDAKGFFERAIAVQGAGRFARAASQALAKVPVP